MANQSEYFREGSVSYAKWAATQWRAPRPRCPYAEGEAAREWRTGFDHWLELDYDSPRVWTDEAIERISANGQKKVGRSATP